MAKMNILLTTIAVISSFLQASVLARLRAGVEGSIFQNPLDLATWTQYVCEQLWRAGAYDRLESSAIKLHRLAQQLPQSQAAPLNIAYNRNMARLNAVGKMWQDGGVDRKADRLYTYLASGRVQEAKALAKLSMDRRDYRRLSEPLKAMIITTGLVLFDRMLPGGRGMMIPLWSPQWSLTLDEKIVALIRARQLLKEARLGTKDPHGAPAFRVFPRMNQVDARVLSALGRNVSGQFMEPNIADDPKEIALLTATSLTSHDDYCGAQQALMPLANSSELYRRIKSKCRRERLLKTYKVFCQIGATARFPIADALWPAADAVQVESIEKTFWTRLWIGDCPGAASDLQLVLTHLHPQILTKRPYLQKRLAYMQQKVVTCRPMPGLYASGVGMQLMNYLQQSNPEAAEALWRQVFSLRPTDRMGKLWKLAIMIVKYPRSIYSPCTGNALLTGNSEIDSTIFSYVERVVAGQTHPYGAVCVNNVKDNMLWMRAAYIAGRFDLVAHYAQFVIPYSGVCNQAHQLIACVHLCGQHGRGSGACTAVIEFGRMCPKSASLPHARIGRLLAERLCQQPTSIVEDPSYLSMGASPKRLSSIMSQYYSNFAVGRRSRHAQLEARIQRGLTGFKGASSVSPTTAFPSTRAPPMKQDKIDLPPQKRKLAMRQAHAAICPCMDQKQIKRMLFKAKVQRHVQKKLHQQQALLQQRAAQEARLKRQTAHLLPHHRRQHHQLTKKKLYQAIEKVLRRSKYGCSTLQNTHHHHRQHKSKLSKETLMASGALQAAAKTYSKAGVKCPCLQENILKELGMSKLQPLPPNPAGREKGHGNSELTRRSAHHSHNASLSQRHGKHRHHHHHHGHHHHLKHRHGHHNQNGHSRRHNHPHQHQRQHSHHQHHRHQQNCQCDCVTKALQNYPFLKDILGPSHQALRSARSCDEVGQRLNAMMTDLSRKDIPKVCSRQCRL